MTGERPAGAIVVIGVGTPYRADDAVGSVVAAGLARRLADLDDVRDTVRVLELDGEPVRLTQAWEDAEVAIVIDAVQSGAPPGTLHRLSADEVQARAAGERTPSSGHALGLGDALDLAAALDRLPGSLEVYAVEAGSFELGAPMTPVVMTACEALVDEIAERIERLSRRRC